MSTRLFVSNFPFATTEQQLRETFSEIGAVERVHLVFDQGTGKPRGFGFVVMESEDDAPAAIQQLDGSSLGGRKLVVAPAKARSDRPDRQGRADRRDRRDHREDAREARW